jgi:hypothetical protein
MAEREILGNPVNIRLINQFGSAEGAAAFRAFARQQVAFAGTGTHDFAGARDLKPLGYSLFRFIAARTSHKCNNFLLLKRARNIGVPPVGRKCYFTRIWAI